MKKVKIILLLTVCASLLFCSCVKRQNEIVSKNSADKTAVYAVWLNYNELAMNAEADKSESAFRNKAEKIISDCAGLGINRVFAQVRPFSDALYNSSYFPASAYLSSNQGEYIGYDALSILCEYAQKYNISVDAWINPYRVSYDSDFTKLSQDNPARIWLGQGRTDVVKVIESGIYYNPCSLEAQRLVLDGVRELLDGYPIGGIHIDDYFYPTDDLSFDEAEYLSYRENGGRLGVDSWRRENVNSLVSAVYSLVHSYSNHIFSISPCGDIEKNICRYYADVELWLSDSGYCDLMIPQLYYGYENETKPFSQTLEDWLSLERNSETDIAVGLAYYKYGSQDAYAGSGRDEWLKITISYQSRLVRFYLMKNCAAFRYTRIHTFLRKIMMNFVKKSYKT